MQHILLRDIKSVKAINLGDILGRHILWEHANPNLNVR